jgi:hypothetical protein
MVGLITDKPTKSHTSPNNWSTWRIFTLNYSSKKTKISPSLARLPAKATVGILNVGTWESMTRAKRNLIRTLVAVAIVAGLVYLSWRPLFRYWAIRNSAEHFRHQFRPNQDMYVCIDEDSWAWLHFGGTRGLPVLQELSQDSSLAPCGRALASNLVRRISYGQHLQSYDEMNRSMNWCGRIYIAYIREQDQRFLKKRSQTNPAGDVATRAAHEE